MPPNSPGVRIDVFYDRSDLIASAVGTVKKALIEATVLVVLLLVGSFVIFLIVDLAPGDPLAALLGTQTPDPERIAQLTAQIAGRPLDAELDRWLGTISQTISASVLVAAFSFVGFIAFAIIAAPFALNIARRGLPGIGKIVPLVVLGGFLLGRFGKND